MTTDTTETNILLNAIGLDRSLWMGRDLDGLNGISLIDETFTLTKDALGSVSELTTPQGDLVQRYEYTSYGQTTVIPGPAAPNGNPIRNTIAYTSREWEEELDLYHYRARWYDPEMGRFLSPDPIGFAGGDANLYRYVLNNPQRYTDPNGLFNVLFGVGGSGAAVTGGEASGGVFVNPGFFGQQAAGGVFGSVGASVGLNVSADIFAGVVFGGSENISGTTINQNISIGPLSLSGFFDPSTGSLVGFTAGLGPSATSVGVSTSISSTGAYNLLGQPAANACGR